MERARSRTDVERDVYGLVQGDNASVTMHIYQQTASGTAASYRSIIGIPPLTDASYIQQRVTLVENLLSQLMQPAINALILVGIGGVGKSTLAALLYRFVEAQHKIGKSSFAAPPLWLDIDATTTFADVMGTICQAFNAPVPDLGSLTPASQALVLHNILARTSYRRLIIFNQFEKLLSWQTGKALERRPGVGEWLDALNSQLWESGCRLVMTSRLYSGGMRQETMAGVRQYPVEGLSLDEGVDLLRMRGMQERETELRKVVIACNGHALSLELLIQLVQEHGLSLVSILNNTALWDDDIAEKFLDILFGQLSREQQDLLRAFSIYRIPVPLEAPQAILPTLQPTRDLKFLLKQRLVQAGGGRYQLHVIVASYARKHLEQSDEANKLAVIKAHEKAAQYYMQQASTTCPPRAQRRRVEEVQPLIEAFWHYCQAAQWLQAYKLMVDEAIFIDLKSWGSYVDLLDLYELMLPLDRWRPDDQQSIHIYNDLGRLCSDLDNKMQALIYYNDALKISKRLRDSKKQASTLNNLGWIYVELEDREQASGYFQQALTLSRETGDYRREASTLNGLGRLSDGRGEKELARKYYEQALIIYSQHREKRTLKGEGWTLNNLEKVNADLGQKELALDSYTQALAIRRDILNNLWEEGRTLKNLGNLYLMSGQLEESLRYLERALSLSKEVGDRRGEGRALNILGRFYLTSGEKAKAMTCLEQAQNICRETRDRRDEAMVLQDQAELLSDPSDQQDKIIENYKTALNLYRETGDRWGEANVLQKIGTFYFQQKRYDVTFSCFLLARDIFSQVQSPDYGDLERQLDNLRKMLSEEQLMSMPPQGKLEIQYIIDKMHRDK